MLHTVNVKRGIMGPFSLMVRLVVERPLQWKVMILSVDKEILL
jgi:hypothetical protein